MEKNPYFDYLNKIQKLEDQFYKAINKNNIDISIKILLDMRNIHGYLINHQLNISKKSDKFYKLSCIYTIIYMINDIIIEAEDFYNDNVNDNNNDNIDDIDDIISQDDDENENKDKLLLDLLKKKISKDNNSLENTIIINSSKSNDIDKLINNYIKKSNIEFDHSKNELPLFNGNLNSKEGLRMQLINELQKNKDWNINIPTLMFFYLNTCNACIEVKPKWNKLKLMIKNNKNCNILELDLNDDKNEKIRLLLNVLIVPTFYLFSNLSSFDYLSDNFTGKNVDLSVILDNIDKYSDIKKNYKLIKIKN